MFVFCQTAIVQQFTTTQYTTVDGLPNNAIRVLFVDSRNILWIGTENGIAKMENGEFKSFFESDGLAFNNCWAITEDINSHLWFGSYGGGLSVFDGKKFTAIKQENGLVDQRIRHLYPYKDKVLIGTENGISILDITDRSIQAIPSSKNDNEKNYVSGFFEFENRIFYTTYGNGLYEIIFGKDAITIHKIHGHAPIYAIGVFDGVIFSSNKGHVDKFTTAEFIKPEPFSEKFGHSIIWKYLEGKSNTIYGTAWGIYKPDGGLFQIQNNDILDLSAEANIDCNVLVTAAMDKAKSLLYVGSNEYGFYATKMENNIRFHPFEEHKVSGFAGVDKPIAILHEEGVYLFDNQITITKKQFKERQQAFFKKNPNYAEKGKNFFEMDDHITAEAMAFYEIHFHQDHIYTNTNIGIFRLDRNGNFTNYLPIHSYCIGFTPEGKLIETNPYGGVRIYKDLDQAAFSYFTPKDPLVPTQIAKVERTPKATYFASVFHGLFKYEDNVFQSYKLSGKWEEEKFKAIHYTKDGELLMGTEFGDFYRLGLEPEFTIKSKLPKASIMGNSILFLESYEDAFFIGTEKGLNIYQNGTIRFLDMEQGLSAYPAFSGKVYGKELYLGSNAGYYVLDLPKILNQTYSNHQLAITNLEINHEPSTLDDYLWFTYQPNELELNHDKNTLLIDFKPIDHPYPKKLLYRYRLRNDAEWSPFSAQSSLTLPYLPPGKYDLVVETTDLHSGTSSISQLLKINIKAPFYIQGWFIALCVCVLLGSFIGFYKVETKKLRNNAQIQKRLAETKLEALRSQMNPHFIFNAINSIQYYILKNNNEVALDYLNKFSKLIRTTLENSSTQKISLKKEIEYLQAYIQLENERKENRVEWDIVVSENLDSDNMYLPPMLLQPFIENVFIHAFSPTHPNPKLSIEFKNTKINLLTCIIRDNGVGMDKAPVNGSHNSKGLKLITEILTLLPNYNADSIAIESVENEGTTVTLQLPFQAAF